MLFAINILIKSIEFYIHFRDNYKAFARVSYPMTNHS